MGFWASGSEKVRIDSSGRLLVGTTSSQTIGNADAQLQLSTDSATGYAFSLTRAVTDIYGPQINLRSTRGTAASPVIVNNNDQLGSIAFYGYDGSDSNNQFANIAAFVDGTPGSNDCPGRLVFSTTADGASSPTERMRITSGGRVTLGSDASGLLGGSFTTSLIVTPVATANTGSVGIEGVTVSTSTRYHQSFSNPNGVVGSISTNGSATSFNTSSDYRLKENVVDITDGITRVNQLQVHRFNFIADPDTTVDGFIAHEAQAVVPECVTGTKDEVDDEGNPVYQGIDQSKLVPLLTAALQEALAEIESLKARVTALEP